MPFLQIAPELQLQVVGEPARPLPRVIFCAISLPAHAERGTPGWGVVAAVVLHQVVDHPLLHKSSSAQAISPSLAVTQSVKGRNHNRLSLAIPPLRAFSKGHTRRGTVTTKGGQGGEQFVIETRQRQRRRKDVVRDDEEEERTGARDKRHSGVGGSSGRRTPPSGRPPTTVAQKQ